MIVYVKCKLLWYSHWLGYWSNTLAIWVTNAYLSVLRFVYWGYGWNNDRILQHVYYKYIGYWIQYALSYCRVCGFAWGPIAMCCGRYAPWVGLTASCVISLACLWCCSCELQCWSLVHNMYAGYWQVTIRLYINSSQEQCAECSHSSIVKELSWCRDQCAVGSNLAWFLHMCND